MSSSPEVSKDRVTAREPGRTDSGRQRDEQSAARRRIAELERKLTAQRDELRAVQSTLEMANEYLTAVLGAVSDALVVVDEEQVMLTVNRAVTQLLGYADHELLGEHLRFIAPDLDVDLTGGGWQTGDGAHRRMNASLRGKDGQQIPVMLALSRLQDAMGDVVYVCAATDMRERLRLESELHHAQRLESLGQLSAGVAHEINNPLGYVIGNLDYLRDEIPAHLLAEVPEVESAIEQACEGALRVRQVVGDLLAFARTDDRSRAPDHQLESVDLLRVLESTLRLATGQLNGRARLTRRFAPVPRVRAQRARLGQVFLNLIMNAIQALDSDSETAAQDNELCIATSVEADRVVVEVRDNGPGIPPEVRARIFEPFFTTKPFGIGTGLGLSICHGIVKRFGGDITVDTEVGRGTAFFVHLQVAS